jgi:glycosyltransferase involved in cell wall biosynthesis
MNLLIFNLAVDADDPILGFTTDWINRLAARWDHVDVITMRVGRNATAPNVNVYSVGKEKGYSERRRAVEFYRILAPLLRQRRYVACFAHMMPLFAVMGSPLLRLCSVPITLWYTHRQKKRTLEWAARISQKIVTAADDSFPIKSDKVRVLGHGIDTDFFALQETVANNGEIVHVARLMPIKNQEMLIRAVATVPNSRAVFVGDVPPETDATYKAGLIALADRLGVKDRVVFSGSQSAEGVRDHLWRATVAVNLSPPGLFDKAALESMAAGVPTIVSSTAFRPLLGEYAPDLLLPAPNDHNTLAVRLSRIMQMSEDERREMGSTLRERVAAAHGIDGLIVRLDSVLRTGEIAS